MKNERENETKFLPCVKNILEQSREAETPMVEDSFDLFEVTYKEFWGERDPEEIGSGDADNLSNWEILNVYVRNLMKVEEMLEKYTIVTKEPDKITMMFALPDELYDEFWDARGFYDDYEDKVACICATMKEFFRYEMDGKEYNVRLGALAKYIYTGDTDWLPQMQGVIIPCEYRDKVFEAIKNAVL